MISSNALRISATSCGSKVGVLSVMFYSIFHGYEPLLGIAAASSDGRRRSRNPTMWWLAFAVSRDAISLAIFSIAGN
jgi:hypothetical protein